MALKNKLTSINVKDNELYIIPSVNEEMRDFVKKFKIDMMEHIIHSIKFAMENKIPVVEVFQFKNSSFVVTISKNEFIPNLDHIHKFYKKNEMFELCSKVESLRNTLKNSSDEKKKPDKLPPDNNSGS